MKIWQKLWIQMCSLKNYHLLLLQVIDLPVSWVLALHRELQTRNSPASIDFLLPEVLKISRRGLEMLPHSIHCKDFAQAPYQGLSCHWRPLASSFEDLWRMQRDLENTNWNNSLEKLLLQHSLARWPGVVISGRKLGYRKSIVTTRNEDFFMEIVTGWFF